MASLVAAQMAPRTPPTSEDWSRLEPLITDLYVRRRWSMDQIVQHLVQLEYRVNRRMVRTRITLWKLQRNHQLQDMVAALRLLGPDPNFWPTSEPRFLIRGHEVTLQDIENYFHRKKIQDPLQWAHSIDMDLTKAQVSLLGNQSEEASQTLVYPNYSALHDAAQSIDIVAGLTTLPRLILTLEEKVVTHLGEYCFHYSTQQMHKHMEPPVHQHSVHGQFGERMRDGIAHMTRNSPQAFSTFFNQGFELVHDLLADCHPMALAQYMAVICVLATHQADSVLSSLLWYVARMASVLKLRGAVAEFLIMLPSSRDVVRTAICCLRAALGVFGEQHPMSWQRFYIQEMLCDALYFVKAHAEGRTARIALLHDQESFYGPWARNVIYNLTKVASDSLCEGDIDLGIAEYNMALERAEHLDGHGRAKVRFVALEGLAEAEQMYYEKMRLIPAHGDRGDLICHLNLALLYTDEAILEARTFEESSRRRLRALERRKEIENLLSLT